MNAHQTVINVQEIRLLNAPSVLLGSFWRTKSVKNVLITVLNVVLRLSANLVLPTLTSVRIALNVSIFVRDHV